MTDLLDLKPPREVDRAAARTLHVRGIMILEHAFEKRTIRSLRRVLKSVSGNFGALVSADSPGEAVASFDDLAAINAGWAVEVEEQLIPALLDTFAAGAQNTSLSVAGVIDIPEFVHTQSVGWMSDASNRLARVSDDAWQAVRSELTVGLTEGESIEQLQRRIRSTINVVEARARTIARTEVIGAVNAGSFYEAKAMGVETKTWLATDDKRTRPTHSEADGQQVNMDDMYVVGGVQMRFPHDPAAPPGETVNCRCTNLYDHNDLCMCVPGWAQTEADEQLVAASTSNCGCSGDAAIDEAEGQTAAGIAADAVVWTFAEEHTGAMVALIPADPEALAIEGGEAVEELHVTLFYLGDAADVPAELQTAMLAEIGSRVADNWAGPIEAQVFGASIWNPTSDDPSLVLSVGGPDLQSIRDDVGQGIINAPGNVDGDTEAALAWDMPEQHRPWVPHLCLEYAEPELLVEHMPTALERVGPVTLDRVRVAFADEVHDFKLGGD